MSQSTTNETPGHAANHDTWLPAWQRNDKFYKIFAPYSRAKESISGRPLPELWDINNGCILWLPARAEIKDKIIPGTEIDRKKDGFFDHPVVVLKVALRSPTSALLTCAQMTSFGNRNLRQAKSDSDWRYYLPITPSAPHPDTGILLDLENEKEKRSMSENSHICLEGIFTLDFTAFRCYAEGQRADGYRQRLTKVSFDQLAQRLGIEPGIWIKTDTLWEHFEDYFELET
ncbi:hypothetical protein JMJ35_002306 [Cladonia borealis]|uniref:Uncharacterized protein n=1 Tax=Cladonia borealis TaxID=184061 RepID=A0AA39R4U8_9LECA|nr:hypothetical protein JMJ35_002306 [Cladonia borealis]